MKYSALTWVKTTIDESLKQTRQALEQFVENSADTSPLQQCLVWLHEIQGALKIMELQTASALVQEVELTLKTLLAGKIESNPTSYDALMRALVQLPNYLDHLIIVKQDVPTALLPLLNGLRALRKQPLLTASNLPSTASSAAPDLSVSLPPIKSVKLPDDKLKPHVQKLRAAYQKGLITLMKAPKLPDGLKFLYMAVQKLQEVTGPSQMTKVWWITEGIIEALLQKGLVINNALLTLLKQMDALIKQLAEHGNTALKLAPPKPLLTNLLLYAGQARSKGKQITAVKTLFKLGAGGGGGASQETIGLGGPDIELMSVVVSLLKDDFARVEETLDIFNRAEPENRSVTELAPLVAMLRDMANTLGMLGLVLQRKLLLQQAALISEISGGRKKPELSTLLGIANALLTINAALDVLGVHGGHAKQRLQQDVNTKFWDTPQFGIVLTVVVNEAKIDLAQVIEPLVNFINSGSQDDALMEVPSRLKQVEGFLSIQSHERAAKLLAKCNHYIAKTFIKEATVPPEEKLKSLADFLIGLEFYLDTLAGNPMDAENILTGAEKKLTLLLMK